MIKEVKAGLLHSASTDTNPQHSFCPKGLRSWCKYQQIEAKRQEYLRDQHMEGCTPTEEEVRKQVPSYKHQEALPPAIVELLEPIYDRLSSRSLLSKCVGGYTQNACESFNALLWKRCSKDTFSGRTHLDFAAADAVLHFNQGKNGHAMIFPNMGIEVGQHSSSNYTYSDTKRRAATTTKNEELSKKIRQSRRLKRAKINEQYLTTEGIVYEAGGADIIDFEK